MTRRETGRSNLFAARPMDNEAAKTKRRQRRAVKLARKHR